MKIALIAAMARNRVIGRENRMPWHLPEDLKKFKALTLGHPIIMGRKTFESLGRPLPGRLNLVLSRSGTRFEGAESFTTLEAALARAAEVEKVEAFVIGGEEIYRLALPHADRLYLTLLESDYEGDASFPEWDARAFREIASEARSEPFPFRWVTFERSGPAAT